MKLSESSTRFSIGRKRVSADKIDALSRVRLSRNFILRDFLFCSSSASNGLSNFPEDPAQVVRSGRVLCDKLLEPILSKFGRFAITYGYQSRESMDLDLSRRSTPVSAHSSSPHHWDRATFGHDVYARVDVLPFCVEDGEVSKKSFGHWVMHNLDVDLCMSWTRSSVFCLTVSPLPRRCWIQWGRPHHGEPKQEVLMGADYWQRIYPQLAEHERPKFAPSATDGRMQWGRAQCS